MAPISREEIEFMATPIAGELGNLVPGGLSTPSSVSREGMGFGGGQQSLGNGTDLDEVIVALHSLLSHRLGKSQRTKDPLGTREPAG